jgi:hypothetical protein
MALRKPSKPEADDDCIGAGLRFVFLARVGRKVADTPTYAAR